MKCRTNLGLPRFLFVFRSPSSPWSTRQVPFFERNLKSPTIIDSPSEPPFRLRVAPRSPTPTWCLYLYLQVDSQNGTRLSVKPKFRVHENKRNSRYLGITSFLTQFFFNEKPFVQTRNNILSSWVLGCLVFSMESKQLQGRRWGCVFAFSYCDITTIISNSGSNVKMLLHRFYKWNVRGLFDLLSFILSF